MLIAVGGRENQPELSVSNSPKTPLTVITSLKFQGSPTNRYRFGKGSVPRVSLLAELLVCDALAWRVVLVDVDLLATQAVVKTIANLVRLSAIDKALKSSNKITSKIKLEGNVTVYFLK